MMSASKAALPLAPYRLAPRSIQDREYWSALAADPRRAAILGQIEKACAETPVKPPAAGATAYLAARRANDRSLLDGFWQKERARLAALAARRCLKGLDPADPDDRLLDWLWAFLTQPSWAVSAHLPGQDLPALGKPTLDLAACEMAAFLAELREALKPWMDSVSDTLADSIVAAVDAHVLTPYAQGLRVWWQDGEKERLNNWLGVCGGSILAACESLAVQGCPRPQARARALDGLRGFLADSFTPHGECDEGLGYWNYGVEFACMGWSRLEPAELAAAFDLDRLRLIADYPRRVHLSGNLFFSGNDGSLYGVAPQSFLPWLASATGNEWLAEWVRRSPAPHPRHWGQLWRLLAAPDWALAAAEASALAATPALQFLEDQQTAILRQRGPGGELLACLTGGHNAERHNHNDLGHVLAAVDGQLVLTDLGAPHYRADFFGPRRYTYLAASSRGHSCPVIGEFEQRAGREAAGRVLGWQPAGAAPKLLLDLTAAYPPEAGLLRWTRSLECRPAQGDAPARMVLTDSYRTREPRRIVHVLWSLEPFQEPDERVAGGGLRVRLGPLDVEFSPIPAGLAASTFDPVALLLRDYAGRTLHRIEASYRTDDRGELRVETRLTSA